MRKKLPQLESEISYFYFKLLEKLNTSSSSPKVFFKKVILNSWCFLGRVNGGVSFFLIVMEMASVLSVFTGKN